MASVALAATSFLLAPSAPTVVSLSGISDPVPASLMLKLVNRVSKLR